MKRPGRALSIIGNHIIAAHGIRIVVAPITCRRGPSDASAIAPPKAAVCCSGDLVRHHSGTAQASQVAAASSPTVPSDMCKYRCASTPTNAVALAVASSHSTLRSLANAGSAPACTAAPPTSSPIAATAAKASSAEGGTFFQNCCTVIAAAVSAIAAPA